MTAQLEHANFTVSNPAATAKWMEDIFGWHIRWQGDALSGGHTFHVGTKDRYVALYQPDAPLAAKPDGYTCVGGLNHIAVTVDDLDAVETAVRSQGFQVGDHHEYEPGRRFYFHDGDNIEFEVVQYD